jgi:hypothetical protein
MRFSRWQVLLKLIDTRTVPQNQGMTLNRAVIGERKHFWEHRQFYVALSRVRRLENLCILLPEYYEKISSSDPMAVLLRIPVDQQVVNIVSTISRDAIGEVDKAFSMPAPHPSTTELRVDEFNITPAHQTDHKRMTE